MKKSESIVNLAKALLLFHTKMGKIAKDAKNPFFKSSYATLSTILENIQDPLLESGLTFTQFPTENSSLTSVLIHAESGEFMEGSYSLTPVKNDPQSIGSAITYARRYALGAILGLNIDIDDDGNRASFKPKKETHTEEIENPLVSWDDALSEIKTIEQLTIFYNSNKKIADSEPKIMQLFKARRIEIEKSLTKK